MSNPIDKDRLKEVADDAQQAFWEVVANSYPEVMSGDFPIDSTISFNETCYNMIKLWLESNNDEAVTEV